MLYLTEPDRISQAIARFTRAKILWLDTEVADFQNERSRLSLIQVLEEPLEEPSDESSDRVYILDVLDRTQLINIFIDKIMVAPAIQKVFHYAAYDCRYLGKNKVQNVTCTLEMAKQIPYYILPVNNYKLSTLVEYFCKSDRLDKSEQKSDWSQRPLSEKQLEYAKLDVIYLAQIYQHLDKLSQALKIEPDAEDIAVLTQRYRQIEHRWKLLDTEIKHLKERLKQAMSIQDVKAIEGFKLSFQERHSKKVSFNDLAKVTQESGIELDLPIRLTKELQKQVADILNELTIQEEVEKVLQLKVSEIQEEDLPF
jgi:ribonuclease D